MAESATKLMTPGEFFAWVPAHEGRYELVDGIVVEMMSGASRFHDRIVVNIILSLGNPLADSRLALSDMDKRLDFTA